MINGIKSFFHIGNTTPPAPAAAPPPPPPPPPPARPDGQEVGPPAPELHINQNKDEARTHANEIWLASATSHDAGTNDHRTVDQASVNPDVHDGAHDVQAVQQLFANRDLETAAFAHLTPEQQQQYNNIEHQVDNDPQAHLALQVMLIEGKLTDANHSRVGDQTLLQGLNHMATRTDSMPTISNQRLLGETLREVALPSSIQQKNRESCSAATLQIMTARENPAEYVRIMDGLTSTNRDNVPLVGNGAHVARLAANEADDRTGRTMTSQIWQGAFMQLEASHVNPNAQYQPGDAHHVDQTVMPDGQTFTGMFAPAMMQTAQDLTGHEFDGHSVYVQQQQIANFIDRSLSAHPPQHVPVQIAGGNFGADGAAGPREEVTVTGYANGHVTYTDAHNHSHSLPAAQFFDRIRAAGKVTDPATNAVTWRADIDSVQQNAWNDVTANVSPGHAVPVQLRWGQFDQHGQTHWDGAVDGSHFVQVTKIENGQVYFTNPHGEEDHMPEADFRNRLMAAMHDTGNPAQPAAH